jgi:RNA polymerase sigma factor (sigma-70 family)
MTHCSHNAWTHAGRTAVVSDDQSAAVNEARMSRLQSFESQALPHMPAAHNLAYWLMRSRPDAEDVVQEAYLRAFRAFDSLQGEDIKPWLLTIVRNTAYRALSARQRPGNAMGNVISLDEAFSARPEAERAELQIASDEPSAETMLVRADDQALVQRALAMVAPVFREVLVLREFEELSYLEIADITGTPVGTVMSRLSRARAALKQKLEVLIERQDRNAV